MVETEQFLQVVTEHIRQIRDEIGKVIVGHEDVVEGVLIALVAGGHVLLEGVPGLGKTTLLRTLGDAMHLDYSRIQFTPASRPACGGEHRGFFAKVTIRRLQIAAWLAPETLSYP